MTANPWDKFYWNDWEIDPALKLCSLSAQGLWMRILCICAKADPKGYMLVAGQPVSPADLASLVGKPVPEVETLLHELARYGVFSKDRTGRIYNRKMVRQVKKARTASENGKLGGNPTLLPQREKLPSDKPPLKPEVKPHKPEAISHEQQQAPAYEVVASEMERLNRLLGFDPGDWTSHLRNVEVLVALKSDGCDFEKHILPAAEKSVGRAKRLAYIQPIAREMRDAERKISTSPVPFKDTDLLGWRERMRVWREQGLWSQSFGPKPGESGCRVPVAILEAA